MNHNPLSKFGWLLLASVLFFATACSSLLPPNIPVTGRQATLTSLPPFPSATASPVIQTQVAAVTVVVTATPEPATATAADPPRPPARRPAAAATRRPLLVM